MISERVGSDEMLLPGPVRLFKAAFARLEPGTPMPLDGLYDPAVRFDDPVQRLRGIVALKEYFERLNSRIEWAELEFTEQAVAQDGATLEWVMTVCPRGLRRPVRVAGVSVLRYGQKITRQRDYYDLGAMVYEQVPLLGGLVRGLKKRL
jgi:hypothetical protein